MSLTLSSDYLTATDFLTYSAPSNLKRLDIDSTKVETTSVHDLLAAIKEKKREAIESLAYVRDVLKDTVADIDEERLFGETEYRIRRERASHESRRSSEPAQDPGQTLILPPKPAAAIPATADERRPNRPSSSSSSTPDSSSDPELGTCAACKRSSALMSFTDASRRSFLSPEERFQKRGRVVDMAGRLGRLREAGGTLRKILTRSGRGHVRSRRVHIRVRQPLTGEEEHREVAQRRTQRSG